MHKAWISPLLWHECTAYNSQYTLLTYLLTYITESKHFFKAIRPQAARHVVPRDCFITRSISKEVVPEMVSISVLQHQIPIKHGKFHFKFIHIPSLHLSMSVSIKDFKQNPIGLLSKRVWRFSIGSTVLYWSLWEQNLIYCSNLQTVSEKFFSFGLKRPVGVMIFCSDLQKIQKITALRGAEFHGNTRRDSTSRILSQGSKIRSESW